MSVGCLSKTQEKIRLEKLTFLYVSTKLAANGGSEKRSEGPRWLSPGVNFQVATKIQQVTQFIYRTASMQTLGTPR
jgi:hypothetical protein